MTTNIPIARLYQDSVASAVDLFQSLSSDDWAAPVPCTPAWTVRDVLSHASGVADDIINGRVEGAATDAWAAAQVERYRDDDPSMLLGRWQEQAGSVGTLIDSIDEQRPVFDCHSHEQDVRHALKRPGNRDSEIIELFSSYLATSMTSSVPVTISLTDGTTFGQAEATVSGLTRFELFRSRLGRRSAAQVRAYAWSGSAPAVDTAIEAWFAFGPSSDPIEE